MRCFIIGAVHIAQPLAQMLTMADYAVTVIDPRGAFATEARFPGVELTSANGPTKRSNGCSPTAARRSSP